jgi:hypothetical protein
MIIQSHAFVSVSGDQKELPALLSLGVSIDNGRGRMYSPKRAATRIRDVPKDVFRVSRTAHNDCTNTNLHYTLYIKKTTSSQSQPVPPSTKPPPQLPRPAHP